MNKRLTSYADEIAATKVLLSGLKANSEGLSKWGIDSEFLAAYDQVFTEFMGLDNEQEALKARLKEKAAALDGKVETMLKHYGNAKKIVKMHLPKESWKEFGIEDVR